jgi:hypothetical protein
VQESLSLTGPARLIARLAVPLDLCNVPPDGLPALDLARVLLRHAAAYVVAALPLEPAAWIIGMYPALMAPDRQRLTGIDAEVVQGAVAPRWRQPGSREPARRKLLAAIRHVLAAEHAKCEHFLRSKLGAEFGVEILSSPRG